MTGKITELLTLLVFLLCIFTTSILTQEQAYDPSREPIFDKAKIMKDLDKLSIKDSYFYAHDLNMEKRYKAAIFALEYTINKNPVEIKEWSNFFDLLGRLYINLKNFNKAFDALSLQYQYFNYHTGLPKNKEQIRKYEIGNACHYILVLDEARIYDGSLFTKVLESARQFLIKYPDAVEEKKEIEKLIKNYESEIRSQAESKKEQEKIIKLAQEFLNKNAEYIKNKDKEGLYKFFLTNSTSEKIAIKYSDTFIQIFFPYKQVTFTVTNAAHCFSEDTWCVTFKWWTEPKHILQGERTFIKTFWTVKIVNRNLYLTE